MGESIIAFISLIAIVVIVFITTKLRKNQTPKYDERQEMVRGKAYKYAFFTMLIFGALYMYCSLFIESELLLASVALMIDMFIGLVVYAVYSIWNDAFATLNGISKSYIIFLACTVVLNLGNAIGTIKDGSIIANGTLTLDSISLVCAISLTIVLVTMLVKKLMNREAE